MRDDAPYYIYITAHGDHHEVIEPCLTYTYGIYFSSDFLRKTSWNMIYTWWVFHIYPGWREKIAVFCGFTSRLDPNLRAWWRWSASEAFQIWCFFFWPLASLNKSIPYAPHAPYSMVYSHISAIFTKKLFIKWPKCRWKMVKIDEHSIWDWLTADCPTFWWSPSWPRVQLVYITRILSWSVWFHQRKEWNILGMS